MPSGPDGCIGVGLFALFLLIVLLDVLFCWGIFCSPTVYFVLVGLALCSLAAAMWIFVGPTGRQSRSARLLIAGVLIGVAALSLLLRLVRG